MPEDVSVFGFDNQELAEMTNPPLASVHQPGYQMGATAADCSSIAFPEIPKAPSILCSKLS